MEKIEVKLTSDDIEHVSIFREGLDEICKIMSKHGDLEYSSNGYRFDSLDEIQKEQGKSPKDLAVHCVKYCEIVKRNYTQLTMSLDKRAYISNHQGDEAEASFLKIREILRINTSQFRNFFSKLYINIICSALLWIIFFFFIMPLNDSDLVQIYAVFAITFFVCGIILLGSSSCYISLRKKHDTFLFRNKEELLAKILPPALAACAGSVLTWFLMK